LSHRGPDGKGLFFDEAAGVGLGHRRLAVLDLSQAGLQPMGGSRDGAWIVYNGEVYNFREIRSTLESCGHRLETQTDTEVVLKAYLQWGVRCLERFVGMFAFAVWDGCNKRLFLARDRLGIKPLYYHLGSGKLLFASELKGLMAFQDFPKDVDREALSLFLHYQYVPEPRSVFKGTFKLLPGHYAVYDGGGLRAVRYWEPPEFTRHTGPKQVDEHEALDELERLVTRAVTTRLMSDVPLGALLSGGTDSSLVTAAMRRANVSRLRTFSIGFREPGYDEAPWARKVAEHLETEHTEFYVTPEQALEVVPKLPEIYDEPFADSSAIPTFLVSRLARSKVTVALSGDGGDEQFCGYVRYWSTAAAAAAMGRAPVRVRGLAARVLAGVPVWWLGPFYGLVRDRLPQKYRVADFVRRWRSLLAVLLKGGGVQELYRSTVCLWEAQDLEALLGHGPPSGPFEEAFSQSRGVPLLHRLMAVDKRTYLPNAMLTKLDRASMAVGLEVRVPLLDHLLVEYTATLPESLLYRNGRGKFLLRKLLQRYLPPACFERPKMGFGVPLARWLRRELAALVGDYLSAQRLHTEGLFDANLVQRLVCEHQAGTHDHKERLWSLVMWEMWRERWLPG